MKNPTEQTIHQTNTISELGERGMSLLMGAPLVILALNLLTKSDLRYWPSSIPTSYASVAGVMALVLGAVSLWTALKPKPGRG